MKVYLNEQHVARRSSVGKWASLLGLAILASGFVISLKFPNMLISFGSLAVGFVLSKVPLCHKDIIADEAFRLIYGRTTRRRR